MRRGFESIDFIEAAGVEVGVAVVVAVVVVVSGGSITKTRVEDEEKNPEGTFTSAERRKGRKGAGMKQKGFEEGGDHKDIISSFNFTN